MSWPRCFFNQRATLFPDVAFSGVAVPDTVVIPASGSEQGLAEVFNAATGSLGGIPPECRERIFSFVTEEARNVPSSVCHTFHSEVMGMQARHVQALYQDEKLVELLGTFGISKIEENASSGQIQQFFDQLVNQVSKIMQCVPSVPWCFKLISPLQFSENPELLKDLLQYVSHKQLILMSQDMIDMHPQPPQEQKIEQTKRFLETQASQEQKIEQIKRLFEDQTELGVPLKATFDTDSLVCFPPELFLLKNMVRLEILNQSDLVAISGKIGKLTQLETLVIENCDNIEFLPEAIGQLQCLRECTLRLDGIHFGPLKFLAQCSRLEHLEIGFNYRYRTPPGWFSQLAALKTLMLYEASPAMIHNREFVFPPHLETVAIVYSELSLVPNALYALTNLRHLNLSGNHIEDVPVEMCNLERLESIDLSDNPLQAFPLHLLNIRSLQKITISHTVSLDQDILCRCAAAAVELHTDDEQRRA